ncbi:hypothetical protein NECAME_18471 [Necator americanus]|uniref:Uncharacterized protein n=1 Tax=Necator americanus TaxID=51031 RepID=W2SUJ6_NECAM|nr:hypothetical protein NECAME_18471 [Necator americanus]ETN73198.1 hypothetical protein NECAME_18471 [Necator americanus]
MTTNVERKEMFSGRQLLFCLHPKTHVKLCSCVPLRSSFSAFALIFFYEPCADSNNCFRFVFLSRSCF